MLNYLLEQRVSLSAVIPELLAWKSIILHCNYFQSHPLQSRGRNELRNPVTDLKLSGDQQKWFEIAGVRDTQGKITVIHCHKSPPRDAASSLR